MLDLAKQIMAIKVYDNGKYTSCEVGKCITHISTTHCKAYKVHYANGMSLVFSRNKVKRVYLSGEA